MITGEAMAKKDFTIEYYNNEADRFFESTVSVDFSKIQEQFLKYVQRPGQPCIFRARI